MKIITRFAPSPTGLLHIGGLRTALYSYLFAKHYDGKFILRIEDTDIARMVQGAAEDIINNLSLFGIKPDEIVYQSSNLYHYDYVAHKLVDQEAAYICTCDQNQDKVCTCYEDRRQINILLKNNQISNYVIRLNVLHSNIDIISVYDELRGVITFKRSTLYDVVLLKSDKYPTYHLAATVDDIDMNITHVFRGEEWISSWPYHQLIYTYLNIESPKYIHLPLILNQDGTKLSKRHNSVSATDYINNGYLPEAIINYIALLGWHESGNREVYSLEELIQSFSIDRLISSSSIFDIKKLDFFNSMYLDKKDVSKLYDHYSKLISCSNCNYINYLKECKNYNIVSNLMENKFEYNVSNLTDDEKSSIKNILQELSDVIQHTDCSSKDHIKKSLDSLNLSNRVLHTTFRLFTYGNNPGPDAYTILYCLGREECLNRLYSYMNKLNKRED